VVRANHVFAAGYSVVAAAGELTGYGRLRAGALTGARGTLLVVGPGPGHDLAHLPPAVGAVVAVEPDAAMRRRLLARVRSRAGRVPGATRVPVGLLAGTAESLPLPDACVDSALVALVLCSVTDPDLAAAELHRVLRPGGTLHVLEHVLAPAGSRSARWQRRIDPSWSRMAAGCRLVRDTRQVLARAGFDVRALRDIRVRPAPFPVAHQLAGTARRLPGPAGTVRRS
jgi:ubiquinone/menaquinone biosynthesis C-methylase UbiE